MNISLTQLRFVTAIVKYDFNVTATARHLHTSQPGISAQLKLLEDQLGAPLFVRHGKRLTGLTPMGEEVIQLARQALGSIHAISDVAADARHPDEGSLSVATTHTQARYALPATITAFMRRFPKVQLRIHQGNPTQISEMVLRGEADLAIATEAIGDYEQLRMLPVYRWNRCLLTPDGHPLAAGKTPLQLADVAAHPIITYDFAFAGRSAINKAFAEQNLQANIVLTAIDADVIKHYVKLGLGVGLVAQMAYDPQQDHALACTDVGHLFEDSITSIGIRRDAYLRQYVYAFIEMFAPHLSRERILSGSDIALP